MIEEQTRQQLCAAADADLLEDPLEVIGDGVHRELDPRRAVSRFSACVLDLLAQSAQAQGDYARAEHLFRRALRIAERALGSDDVEVAALLNNLGVLHKDQGRLDEAENGPRA